jgi:hypothetical protein
MSRKTPLMYHDGDQWRNWECYNTQQSNVAILVGGGPSLNKIDVSNLTGPGKTVFGLNTTYPKVRPDIWVGMDDPKCYDRRIFHEPFPKVMRGNYYERDCEGVPLLSLPNLYFAGVSPCDHKGDIFYRIHKDTKTLIWDKNVFTTAMNLILYMGFKKIYLAGVDFSLDEGHYHHSEAFLPKDLQKWNSSLYEHLYRYTEWLASTGSMCGIDILSLSPGSKINTFLPYHTLEDLNSSLKVPKEGGVLHHCRDIDPEELKTLSPEYKKLLQLEHQTSTWGVMAGKMIGTLESFLQENKATEVLDYGAGSSSFKNSLKDTSIKVYEYDPGIKGIDKSPEPKNYTICIDVLEHIEPDLIDVVLEDLARVTKVKGYFTIAMYPAKRVLKDGRNAHLIIEKTEWWMNKICKYFNISNFSESNKQLDVQVMAKKV